ncbi:PQQ-binding-like beta-propeller repeat protein [bacterium]|nr:PQQ-binding-like beta-propeller repeat protein [bacterium]
MKRAFTILAAASLAVTTAAAAADWPHFRGPNGDGICTETGLLKQWPDGGPTLLWKMKGLGMGYSSLSIADGKFFTMGDLGPSRQQRKQYVMAFDLATRKMLWKTLVGPPHRDGSRCTPTVDGDRLYAIGSNGDLVCCKVADGSVVWKKSFGRDFGGRMMSGWKYSESPLVDGGKLVCTPGGSEAMMVALDKTTGAVIWKCAVPDLGRAGKPGAGYSSIIIGNACGVKQYVQLFGKGVFGADAATGKFLWGYNRVANGTANITSPIARGDYVFASTQYSTGSALLKIEKDGDGLKATEVWWLGSDQFQNHHGGVILVGDHLYGGTNKNGGPPTCIEFLTGKIVWQVKPPSRGSAAYLYADGHFVVRYDTGTVALVEVSPERYIEKSTFKAVTDRGPAWPHPIIHDGKLYLRHADTLACYGLK